MDHGRRPPTPFVLNHLTRGGGARRANRGLAPRRPERGGGDLAVTQPDPIDGYLDELLGQLRGDPAMVRRILTETEAHLRDAVDAGATPEAAIARYGDPAIIAAHHRRTGALSWLTVIGRLA